MMSLGPRCRVMSSESQCHVMSHDHDAIHMMSCDVTRTHHDAIHMMSCDVTRTRHDAIHTSFQPSEKRTAAPSLVGTQMSPNHVTVHNCELRMPL